MSHRPSPRPLVFVLLLTLSDYLLWNWSLEGSHDIVGLISGLTLLPLLLVLIALVARRAFHLLAGTAQRPTRRFRVARGRAHAAAPGTPANAARRPTRSARARGGDERDDAATTSRASASKLAA